MTRQDFIAPLMIEVRCNEHISRAVAPLIPYSPAELSQDAAACAEAGATIYHWHARDPASGATVDDPALYVAAARAIRQRTDIILKPTLGADRRSAESRIAHIRTMLDADRHLVDLIAADNFTANADMWNGVEHGFATHDAIYANSRGHVMDILRLARELDVPITLACADVGSIRTGIHFREMGLLPPSIHWELVFSGEALPMAALPTIPSLMALVAAIPNGDSWSALCTSGDILPLAGTIVAMGGHIAIGLGDHDFGRFGAADNAMLVKKLADLAAIVGRPVATISEARQMLGLPLGGRPPIA